METLTICSILEEQLKHLENEKKIIEDEIYRTKKEIHKYMEINK
jgi:hypothetical protein